MVVTRPWRSNSNLPFLARQLRLSVNLTRLALLSIFLAAAGCRDDQTIVPLSLGIGTYPPYEVFYLADRMGLYGPGAVHLIEGPTSRILFEAYRTNAIDAFGASLQRVALWSEQSSDLTIIAVITASVGADALVARPGISSLEELNNKTIGTDRTAVSHYITISSLTSAGLGPRDVTLKDIEYDGLLGALLSQEIDAAPLFEPDLGRAIANGGQVLFDSSHIPNDIIDVVAVRGAVTEKKRQEIVELLKGWIRASEILAKAPRSEISPFMLETEEFWGSLGGVRFVSVEENLEWLGNEGRAIHELIERIQVTRASFEGRESVSVPLPQITDSFYRQAVIELGEGG